MISPPRDFRACVVAAHDLQAAASAWLDDVQLLSRTSHLGGLPADAHSQRPMSLSCMAIVTETTGKDIGPWHEVVASAARQVDAIESSLAAAEGADMLLWHECSLSELLAASFVSHGFAALGGVPIAVFDLTPGAIARLNEPFGRQVARRIECALAQMGLETYYLAQGPAAEACLRALGMRVITDPPLTPIPRRAPLRGEAQVETLDLTDSKTPLETRVLALLQKRGRGPLRVIASGDETRIARATPYLEELVRGGVIVELDASPTPDGEPAVSLQALRASPLLRLAFDDAPTRGAVSDPEALDKRLARIDRDPRHWIAHCVRAIHDAVGHGVKDFDLFSTFVRVDQR